jgi:hypothetical protein
VTLKGETFEVTSGNTATVNSTVTLDGATLLIDSGATLNWNGGDVVATSNGGTLTNNGTININCGLSGVSWTSTIVNNGSIWWNSEDTGGINHLNGTVILASGLTIGSNIEVSAGMTLVFQGGDTWYEGGILTVDSGGTLDWSQVYMYVDDPVTINNYGTAIFAANGNSGTVIVAGGSSLTVNNHGTIVGTLQ